MVRFFLLFFFAAACSLALQPSEVVIVYNGDSALSRAAADRYREVRGIPRSQVLPLHGLGNHADISRETFDQKVRMELLMQGKALGISWPCGPKRGKRQIRAMVLMPDLPLRVGGVPKHEQSGASLDSELMLLGSEYPLSGPGRNPLYGKTVPKTGEKQKVMIVCRIDAPDEATVYRMINEPAQVEKTGLWGWVVVDEGGPYKAGDEMFKGVAKQAKKCCQPLFYETSKNTLADGFPLMSQTAVYFGWYANPANGPFRPSAPQSFRFAPGAIAFHLHSFSATSIKDNTRWVGALLQRGAVVTAGNVAEPYLSGCINYDILYNRLLAGDTVGEASLSATPCLSWMGVVLGDPLYRPFPQSISGSAETNPFFQWQFLCLQTKGNFRAVQNAVERLLPDRHGATYAEIFAWYCSENGRQDLSAQYFELAAGRYTDLPDRLRASMLMVTTLALTGNRTKVEACTRRLLDQCVGSPYQKAVERSVQPFAPVRTEGSQLQTL